MTVFKIILILSSLISLFLSGYSFTFRRSAGALTFSVLMLAGAFYSFGYAFELSATSVQEILRWLNIEYIGIPAIPTLWLIFAIQFTGKKKWLTPGWIVLVSAISMATFTLQHTNNLHHFFYRSIEMNVTGAYTETILIKGPWYWVHIVYSNITILTGNLLFLDLFLTTARIYRRQALIMLIGSMGPWMGHLIYVFGISPHSIDFSPIAMVLAGMIYTWGMFHYKILDLMPIAAEHIFQSMQEGVIIIDRKKRVVSYNEAISRISPQFVPEAIGKLIHLEFEDLSRVIIPVVDRKSELSLYTQHHNDQPRTYQVRASAIKYKDNRIYGWAIIFNEVTQLQEIEKSLRDSERKYELLNSTKDKFFRIISHDLKSPFNQLSGLTTILKSEFDAAKKDEQKQMIDMIHQVANNGNKLIENLLLWANAQTDRVEFRPQRISVNEIARQSYLLIQSLAKNKDILLIYRVHDDLFIHADRDMIDLVIRNLLTNAVKFTRRGGEIELSGFRENGQVVIKVRDNGVGITPDQLNNLFKIDKIQSTPGTEKEKGTGLGLSLCKEYIDKNSGRIFVKSEPGKGSEFTVSFPDLSQSKAESLA